MSGQNQAVVTDQIWRSSLILELDILQLCYCTIGLRIWKISIFFQQKILQNWNIRDVEVLVKDVKDDLLFVYAFSGCDSTSAIFGKGKVGFAKLFRKCNDLKMVAGGHRRLQRKVGSNLHCGVYCFRTKIVILQLTLNSSLKSQGRLSKVGYFNIHHSFVI